MAQLSCRALAVAPRSQGMHYVQFLEFGHHYDEGDDDDGDDDEAPPHAVTFQYLLRHYRC